MLEKDKLWLEYRVNVGNVSEADINSLLSTLVSHVKSKDDSVMSIVIPVRNEESSVRLIYDPKGKQNKEQLKLAKEYMEIVIKEFYEKKIINYGI